MKYTKDAFLAGIKKSIISITTEKGLEFINGQDIKDEYWRSYIKNSENRRERKNKCLSKILMESIQSG